MAEMAARAALRESRRATRRHAAALCPTIGTMERAGSCTGQPTVAYLQAAASHSRLLVHPALRPLQPAFVSRCFPLPKEEARGIDPRGAGFTLSHLHGALEQPAHGVCADLHLRRHFQRREFCAAAPPGDGGATEIFDENLKAAQRERVLLGQILEGSFREVPPVLVEDPLVENITENLLDRLQDCTRKFPRALILGGAFGNVLAQLGGRGGVEHVTVVDTSPRLMEACEQALRANLPAGSLPELAFLETSPGEVLPIDPESFDVVIACLGLHWYNDLPGLLLQCRFALKPDGLFLGAMFGGETLQELRIACTLAELERKGGVSPRTSPLAQVRDAGNLLGRAGLNLTTVDVDTLTVQYPSAVELTEHLRTLGETNATKARNAVLSRDTALAAAAVYQHMFSAEGQSLESSGVEVSSVTATFQVIFLSGWAPHSSQQKAKARGSATVSFDDIRGVVNSKESKP